MGDPRYHGATRDDAEVLCIVVHGRGQTQQDMMDFIVDRLDLPAVRFALPKSAGEGWYAARAIDPLSDATRAEMQAGLDRITDLIAAEKTGAPGKPVLLCGFSQGACMSMELLMRHAGMVDAACLLTGCRVGAETDDLPLEQLRAKPVYASCGDNDPWIPQAAYHRMLGDLTRAGARIRTDMFPGRPHEVAQAEIAVLSQMLRNLAAGAAVLDGAA